MTPQVIAHRGSSAVHADNSWAAFEAAMDEGADAIECDVQATSDGALVVRHDLAIGGRLVCELSSRELDRAEPGLIRLADLLDWAEGAKIGVLVEIKEPDAAAAVVAMVASSAARNRVVIGSFHGPALGAMKATQPGVKTSLMIGSVLATRELLRLAEIYRVDGVHLCWESRAARPHRLVDSALIDRLRRAGLATTLWHEEREDELRALVALEPDAICTNTPAALRRIVDQHHLRRIAVGGANEVQDDAIGMSPGRAMMETQDVGPNGSTRRKP